MKLQEWRKSQNISRTQLARRFGRTFETVRRWESGERIPNPVNARAIFEFTGGMVTPNDFHGVGEE